MREIVKLSLTLAIICAVAGAALAAGNMVTSPIIEERERTQLLEALGILIPGADDFTPVEINDRVVYYLASAAGRPAGAVMLAAGSGFNGPVNLLVSIDPTGQVQGTRVASHRETVGIGTKIEEDSFLSQFAGKTMQDQITVGQDINAVTGATVSSRAVANGVKQALSDYAVYILGEEEPVLDISIIEDGVYQGAGFGYGEEPIVVNVTVAAGRITRVEILSHSESEYVSDPAIERMPQRIVDEQSAEVDVISTATQSSRGIMEAVKNALMDAPTR